jgi:hypothetical protein
VGVHHGYLVLERNGILQEVINHARTAAYLANPDFAVAGIRLCDVLDEGGCATYRFIPECDPYTGELDWVEQIFDDPTTDQAPWHNDSYPESADALGFWIEEWTGLGAGHTSRDSITMGRPGGGVTLGRATSGGRVQKFQVLLFARSEEGMQYLFDWLDATLTGVCGGCVGENMMIRRTCGSEWDPGKGIGLMRNVGLTEGAEWQADVFQRGSCYLRRVSFTLTAGDPCVYLLDGAIEEDPNNQVADLPDCFDASVVNTTRYPCRPSCSELDDTCRTIVSWEISMVGAAAPIILFRNDNDAQSIPFRAIVYADPLGIGHSPNPCALRLLGQVYVRPLPAWSEQTWDVLGRTMLFEDVTTGVPIETSAYIDANDPPYPRWFTTGCGLIHLVMEPASLCADWDGTTYTWQGMEFDPPHFPDVSVRVGERTSCG